MNRQRMFPRGCCSVVLAAAGRGVRFGGDVPKQFVRVCGAMLFEHALKVFLSMPEIAEVILVLPPGGAIFAARTIRRYSRVRTVPGGAERYESVRNGIAAATPATQCIAVHDAARPLIDAATVRRALQALQEFDAAVPGIPVSDTIKVVSRNGLVQETPNRELLRAIQTPQVFRREVAMRVYSSAVVRRWSRRCAITDDAQLAELEGFRVQVVEGTRENIKVTTPTDLAVVREVLRSRRGRKG